MNAEEIADLLTPVVEQHALDLDGVEVKPAGKRSVVRVVVDGDGPEGTGPSLDDIAEATRAVSAALDASELTGNGPYTLEVTSRGVGRPLTLPRHWRRNRDRLVKVGLVGDGAAGETITGRITATDDRGVVLDVDGVPRRLDFADITSALVQVELNRKPRPADTEKEN